MWQINYCRLAIQELYKANKKATSEGPVFLLGEEAHFNVPLETLTEILFVLDSRWEYIYTVMA